MNKDELVGYLGALTDEEFAELAAEARSVPTPERAPLAPHAQQVRAAEDLGDWQSAFALKVSHLGRLLMKKEG